MATAKASPQSDRNAGDGGDNAGSSNIDMTAAVLAEVDFKWLMAGHGWDIDMARLGVDPSYAARLLDWAMKSDSPALRESAAKLLAQVNNTTTGDKT